MADQKNPETSTVRSALAAVGAVDDLLRPGRDGCVLDADTAVAALVTLIDEVRALRPHQARDVIDHLEARLAAGALSPRAQRIKTPTGTPFTVYNVGQDSGIRLSGDVDPDYWPVPRSDHVQDPAHWERDPLDDVDPTTAEGDAEPADPLENSPLRRNALGNIEVGGHEVPDPPEEPARYTVSDRDGERSSTPAEAADDPLLDGKRERATAAVDELAARVNAEPEA